MRGKTLGQLVDDLRVEVGMDPNPALSLNIVPKLKLTLRREQERLYEDFNWPFLRIRVDVPLAAGQRYYDVPDELDLERIEKIEYYWGTRWQDLTRGIGQEQFTIYNSDEDVRVEPAYRWDVLDTGSGPQIEIWPVPPVDDRLVRFTGIRKLTDLVSDSDKADLDDRMLVLFAASEFISDGNKAAEKRAKALDLYTTLKARSTQTRSNAFSLGGPPPDPHLYPRIQVAYVRNP